MITIKIWWIWTFGLLYILAGCSWLETESNSSVSSHSPESSLASSASPPALENRYVFADPLETAASKDEDSTFFAQLPPSQPVASSHFSSHQPLAFPIPKWPALWEIRYSLESSVDGMPALEITSQIDGVVFIHIDQVLTPQPYWTSLSNVSPLEWNPTWPEYAFSSLCISSHHQPAEKTIPTSRFSWPTDSLSFPFIQLRHWQEQTMTIAPSQIGRTQILNWPIKWPVGVYVAQVVLGPQIAYLPIVVTAEKTTSKMVVAQGKMDITRYHDWAKSAFIQAYTAAQRSIKQKDYTAACHHITLMADLSPDAMEWQNLLSEIPVELQPHPGVKSKKELLTQCYIPPLPATASLSEICEIISESNGVIIVLTPELADIKITPIPSPHSSFVSWLEQLEDQGILHYVEHGVIYFQSKQNSLPDATAIWLKLEHMK